MLECIDGQMPSMPSINTSYMPSVNTSISKIIENINWKFFSLSGEKGILNLTLSEVFCREHLRCYAFSVLKKKRCTQYWFGIDVYDSFLSLCICSTIDGLFNCIQLGKRIQGNKSRDSAGHWSVLELSKLRNTNLCPFYMMCLICCCLF